MCKCVWLCDKIYNSKLHFIWRHRYKNSEVIEAHDFWINILFIYKKWRTAHFENDSIKIMKNNNNGVMTVVNLVIMNVIISDNFELDDRNHRFVLKHFKKNFQNGNDVTVICWLLSN